MTLEKCWNCGSDKVEKLPGDSWISCIDCGATGPAPDPDGVLWNSMKLLSASTGEQAQASLEVAAVGQMPWRLQIAAQLWAAGSTEYKAEDALRAADHIIAAHEKGGAA